MVKRESEDSRVFAPNRLLGSDYASSAVPSREGRPGSNRRVNELSAIVVQFINVSVSLRDEAILKNVSLRIPRGKVTMITGSVGCGKSTFLRSIIGQVQLSGGSLLMASSCVAYCSQKPWIRNLSIRDNILGEKPLIRTWLNLVLYVCALDIDLARLPNGELTIAGSDGCNLSGGQKQRVVSALMSSLVICCSFFDILKAFARALYAKKEIIVVDDMFTVLDKNTSSAIRIRLFGETEILSANNMTLIMSTSLSKSLQYIQNAKLTVGQESTPSMLTWCSKSPTKVKCANALRLAAMQVPATRPEDQEHPSPVPAILAVRLQKLLPTTTTCFLWTQDRIYTCQPMHTPSRMPSGENSMIFRCTNISTWDRLEVSSRLFSALWYPLLPSLRWLLVRVQVMW